MLNVVCLKHGTKYGPEYVNNLYNMIQRHLRVPHRFVCFTDDSSNINDKIEIRLLPEHKKIAGWWWKPYIFKEGHFPIGDEILFFDLDMVIINNIDKIATYLPNEFVGLRDVGRVFRRHPEKLGSAVLRWPANQYSNIWTALENDTDLCRRFQGDQDWVWHLHKNNIKFFPDDWIISYKWEARDRTELVRIGHRWNFNSIRNPDIKSETSVLAFHGSPDPHEVKDPIIIDNWR